MRSRYGGVVMTMETVFGNQIEMREAVVGRNASRSHDAIRQYSAMHTYPCSIRRWSRPHAQTRQSQCHIEPKSRKDLAWVRAAKKTSAAAQSRASTNLDRDCGLLSGYLQI